jgi:hypothetical protein
MSYVRWVLTVVGVDSPITDGGGIRGYVWRWGYPHSSLFLYTPVRYIRFFEVSITVMAEELEKLKRLKEEGKISDDELVRCIVEIMIKYNMRPKALPEFDAVRMVRETRDE